MPLRRSRRGAYAPPGSATCQPGCPLQAIERHVRTSAPRRSRRSAEARPRGGRTRMAVYAFDITEQKRTERAHVLIARTAELLGSSLDYERTLQEVASLSVPDFADWCGVDVPGAGGLPTPVAIAHADPAR